jgi:hypothetical protein
MRWTRERLIAALAAGRSFSYLHFWGPTPKAPGLVDASCLSQWFPSPFELDGVRYPTAEHAMMAAKARLFRDHAALARIVEAPGPAEAKRIGREVRGYDDARWSAARFDAVVEANVAKFSQAAPLGDFLLGTGERILVEASPRDAIWGIGIGASHADASDPRRWRGQNLLGFALVEVRERLRAR